MVAVACAGHVLMEGDPRHVDPRALAPLGDGRVLARPRFLPVLAAAFGRVVPGERMIWLRPRPVPRRRLPHDVVVRRPTAADGAALAATSPDTAWLRGSWGGPTALAGSGHCWGAFRGSRPVSLACAYFLGAAYEDVTVMALHGHRRQGLALACLAGLCADVAARGRAPSWTGSRDNRPSRLSARAAGFRLFGEYAHFAVGRPARHVVRAG